MAGKKLAEAVTISSFLKFSIIKALREHGVDYIVAPFEADSQLAHLFKTKQVSLVITEDSDLIAFGVTKLLYKLNLDGNGQEIELTNAQFLHEYNFDNFSDEMKLITFVLAGCDYLKSIKGVGFKTAY